MSKVVGESAARIEDRDLLLGCGRFVADIKLPGTLHGAFLRSPHAHARIKSLDVTKALALPGIAAVFTADDLETITTTNYLRVALPDKTYKQHRDRRILAKDETVHVGEAIALVVADDAYRAEDGASQIEVVYDLLPSTADCRAALSDDAAPVHSGAPHNLAAEFSTAYGDVDVAFAQATHVIHESFWTHRGVAHSMECRGCLALCDPVDGKITVWSSTQTPLVAARLLAELFDREEDTVRVVAPDVGGGFGPKLVFYPEEAAITAAALKLRRPVRWLEDRREHFIATTQERDQYWTASIALDGDGKILGVRGTLVHDHGAYTARGLTVPQGAVASLSLAYVVPAYRIDVQVALTNKVPVTPVRGAGQPQGVFVMERLLDHAAEKLKLDRAEIRLRNLVPAEAMPFKKGFVSRGGVPIILDSGDYPACQAHVLKLSNWTSFPDRQRRARSEGRYIGIGLANFVEATGRGPYERVQVRIAASGKVEVKSGAAAMGQSTKTMLAQIVAEQLGGRLDNISVTTGDSEKISMGFGGFNSRQTVMAGSSAHQAALKVREKTLLAASYMLEVDADDLDLQGDRVVVKGASDMNVPLAVIARTMAGNAGFLLPGGLDPGLEATESVVIDAMTYGNGSAVAEVEVDIHTAAVTVRRISFVHDAGRLINPTIAEGQVVGGIVHGIGNALYEWMAFDDQAQPITTTLADYLLVSAAEIPEFLIGHRETPTPLNPLGVKGIGESGVLPIPAAVISAVENALSPFDIKLNQFPVRPRDISESLAAARIRA